MTKKKFFSFLFILYWIVLWASINTMPPAGSLLTAISKFNFFYSFFESIYFIRTVLALLFSILIILYFLYVFFFKKIKIMKIHAICLALFISHLIGFSLNENINFGLFYPAYLAILSIGTICLFLLCNHMGINNIINYFFWIGIAFLIIAFFVVLFGKLPEIKNLNFYEAFNSFDNNIVGGANPRITGLSRTLAVINIFITLYILNLDKFYNKFFLLLLTISSVFLLFMQSRGSLLCYFLTMSVIVLFLIKKNLKIKYFFILIILPILLWFTINNYYLKKNLSENNYTQFNNRIFSSNMSGRSELWSYTLKNYDYKKFFGYGPNGDRFFLQNYNKKHIYGDNVSNALLYTLLSGGLVSISLLILILFEIFKIFKKNIKKFFFMKNNFYINFSIACLFFFFIRSFFENSFGLFSIDFLMTYLSLSYIIISDKKWHLNESNQNINHHNLP